MVDTSSMVWITIAVLAIGVHFITIMLKKNRAIGAFLLIFLASTFTVLPFTAITEDVNTTDINTTNNTTLAEARQVTTTTLISTELRLVINSIGMMMYAMALIILIWELITMWEERTQGKGVSK